MSDGENCAYCEVADELVAGVDGEKFHARFGEEPYGERNGSDEAESDVKTQDGAVFGERDFHVMENQREDERRDQVGDERDRVCGAGTFAHGINFRFVAGIDSHFLHPGRSEENRRVAKEADDHGSDGRDQNGEDIQMFVRVRPSRSVPGEQIFSRLDLGPQAYRHRV